MVNKDILLDLYRHMEWADAAVWTAVLAAGDGPSDPKIRGYLYHLHMVQRLFLRAWREEELKTPFPTFDEAVALMSWGRAYFGEVVEQTPVSVQLKVPRAKVTETCRQLLEACDVSVINVQVLPVEEVIRHLFGERRAQNAAGAGA